MIDAMRRLNQIYNVQLCLEKLVLHKITSWTS